MKGKDSDLTLSNGAKLNFKVFRDRSGVDVISYLEVSFSQGAQIPTGGITANLLREISISTLLEEWFSLSSRAFLDSKQEKKLWNYLSKIISVSTKTGKSDLYYACLAYVYTVSCEREPRRPTSHIANQLRVSTKTLSTQLARAKKSGLLTTPNQSVHSGKAGGLLTNKGKQLIVAFLEEKN